MNLELSAIKSREKDRFRLSELLLLYDQSANLLDWWKTYVREANFSVAVLNCLAIRHL